MAAEFLDGLSWQACELDEMVMRTALPLITEWDLKGVDASIVAAAKLYGADYLYTLDNQLLKIGEAVYGLRIDQLPVSDVLF